MRRQQSESGISEAVASPKNHEEEDAVTADMTHLSGSNIAQSVMRRQRGVLGRRERSGMVQMLRLARFSILTRSSFKRALRFGCTVGLSAYTRTKRENIMKRIAILATVLSSAILPMTAASAAGEVTPKQSVCVPVIVDAGEGPVEGVLCYTQGGRV
jgi:hypothetical protein